ncbi:hypothetical protein VNO78_03729 [Psophocarpus tetragonolobus]|uniref:Uncharacterized protein n=1 Tax=Psophocarpus tetragonolobus TaxID=3891 RepID=A0AAN9XWZ0_PSOTE
MSSRHQESIRGRPSIVFVDIALKQPIFLGHDWFYTAKAKNKLGEQIRLSYIFNVVEIRWHGELSKETKQLRPITPFSCIS